MISEKESLKKLDFPDMLSLSHNDFLKYKKEAFIQRRKFHNDKLTIYYPGEDFPSISVTGTECSMNCKYCNKKFLQNMLQASKPEILYKICLNIHNKGGKGCLISGGYTERGIVPLEPFLDTIKKIKEKTDLILNVHCGLVNRQEALDLAKTDVDLISFDVIGDNRIISEIIGLKKTTIDSYIQSLHYLNDAGLDVIPHVGIGFLYGDIDGVEVALKESLKIDPRLIVFLILWPKKGTEMEKINPPTVEILERIAVWTRLSKPECELSLGCMRPRDATIERAFIDSGINRMEIPRKETIQYAEKLGLKINKLEQCCAVL